MRRSHGFGLFLILILIIGFGIYRGWFSVDQDKLKQDVDPAVQKAKEIGGELKDKINENLNKPKPVESTKK